MRHSYFKRKDWRRCIPLILLISLISLSASAQSYRKSQITLSAHEVPIKNILEEISKKANVKFFYSHQQINVEKKISIKEKQIEIDQLLRKVFPDNNIEFKFEENRVILLQYVNTHTTQKNIYKGLVLDENKNPVIGATVSKEGTSTISTTNNEGRFTMEAFPNEKIKISFIGYKNYIITTTNKTFNLVATLEENVITTNDVVVTGYQTISKERVTGSFSIISGDKINKKLQLNIMKKLEGMIPGFTSYNDVLQIRGQTSLRANSAPLYVVDGFPYEGDLNNINQSEIENITVLKDAAAASIYGARSANGVVVITTRSGNTKRTDVEYSGNVVFKPLVDNRKYLNLMDSRELVDFQKEMFDFYHTPISAKNERLKMREVEEILYRHEAGKISDSEMEKSLDIYRNRNNRDEYERLGFMNKWDVSQQHNLSIKGGTSKYKYSITANYTQQNPYDTESHYNRLGYNMKGTYQFFDWLKADIGLVGSSTNSENKGKGFSPTYMYTGNSNIPSYRKVWDEQGNELRSDIGKSDKEIDRLISLGLKDERVYPLKNRHEYSDENKSDYVSSNIGLNAKIINGLNFNLMYQNEKYNSRYSDYQSKNFLVGTYNNGSSLDPATGKITNYFPDGGMIKETRSDKFSYTLRAQLNFNKEINNKHEISAIAGAERRAVKESSTFTQKLGYDPISLFNAPIDEKFLSTIIRGTESLDGTFVYKIPTPFAEKEDRYVSFYGNVGYCYDYKYDISASIRMDQSNLFGTDPKYQYKPLWSAGASWHIAKENFMKNIKWISQLTLKLTKGINGNIAKEGGPFMIVKNADLNILSGERANYISNPPNSGLRWERTNQTNLALNFGLFKNRISGGVEVYSKEITDLLGDKISDPTTGWSKLLLNYASMWNKGIEFSLNTLNIQTKNFDWRTAINFSYNKNKITSLEKSSSSVYDYIGSSTLEVGESIGTIYCSRWAGLDNKGFPQAYTKDGTKVGSIDKLTKDDLVKMGTSNPPYCASLYNEFNYKGLNLSFMFLMYTGHKMKNPVPNMIVYPEDFTRGGNVNRDYKNYWKPGMDPNDESLIPAALSYNAYYMTDIWDSADKHMLNAGYIKMKDITLGYTLPKSITKKIMMQDITIRGQVENVFLIGFNGKGLNPESWDGTSIYYSTKGSALQPIYSFGLSLKF